MITERKESMSPRGFIRLIRQDDGDIVICVGSGDHNGKIEVVNAVEICTPFTGGGGSSRTYAALIQLMGAMAADNLDVRQTGRKGEHVNDEEQHRIVQWAEDCIKADEEFKAIYGEVPT